MERADKAGNASGGQTEVIEKIPRSTPVQKETAGN